MRVFLTGAAGFIGSHTAEALLARGDEVLGIDNFDPFYDVATKQKNCAELTKHAAFTFAEMDIRDTKLEPLLCSFTPDVGIHFAARPGVRASLEDPLTCADVNVRGTAMVFDCALKAGAGHVVFASSSSVYGERKRGPFRETDRVDHPISPYAATKKAGELLAHTFFHCFGLNITCLRFFTAYGPRQRPEMSIAAFARAIRRGEPITVFGDGSAVRDFTFVEDIVGGVIMSVDRPMGYRVYNLGRGETVSVNETIAVLEQALGRTAKRKVADACRGDVSLTHADISVAAAELGYRPKTPLREGVQRYVAWLESEHTA